MRTFVPLPIPLKMGFAIRASRLYESSCIIGRKWLDVCWWWNNIVWSCRSVGRVDSG